jgi:cell division protein FtsA
MSTSLNPQKRFGWLTEKTPAKQQLAVALDIGTTKVCAIAGLIDEYNRLEVVSFGTVKSEGVARGVVSNIDKTVKAIREAVEIAEKTAGCRFKVVHVGIAGQHIKSHHHMGYLTRADHNAEISNDDVERLIKDMYRIALPPGDKILHVIPQEFTVDDEKDVVDPIGMSGHKLEANFHIITGQMTASKNIIRCIEKAGLEIADITLEPIASATAVLNDQEKEGGVVLVDIGGGTTDITIFKDNIIRHTAVIPFGGNIITDDIKEGCTVLADQAEKLKVKFGVALADMVKDNRRITIPVLKGREAKSISEKNLAKIIQARVEEIFDYVLWEIKRSGYENKLIAGVVLTGGGALLKHIDTLVELHTALPARVGEPVEHLAHGYTKELASPIYATAIGLLKYTIDNMPDKIYVEEIGESTEENKVSNIQSNAMASISPETFGSRDDDEEELEGVADKPSLESGFLKMFRKIGGIAKDFFEPTPDHEL